ncbi:putative Sodium P-type ATPase [Taphrina deformans PYCC 5710]|uniref:P-type Na(+) transporter n=1 Tax=Taphrina deformans (strain PYCC 5710 / ATCC 11124 / CBS 356.35 / IMI 108563 / JCM 9778 / NBRC 8474) TaxID=1097556 RepID=R4XBY1_TAPDE|nr:putative Sodium P-type ATPase [Taphrina deformans PYCC 5710]|eukprot:CCG83314.1 putative Sodium P-type ATPase [Taphrina deformans PYCC 5710]
MSDSSTTELQLKQVAYRLRVEDVASQLQTQLDSGLTKAEAKRRLQVFGKNELEGDGGVSLGAVILGQVFNSMVLVLLIAMIVSFAVMDYISAGVIAAVILINVAVGTYQEYQAAMTMDSLKSLGTPSAHTIRDGQDCTIPSGDLVPGDIVLLKTGDTVPADLRLFESMNLETDEALLTGEAIPIGKVPNELYDTDDVPVGDRLNLAFSSSTVTRGRSKGIVFSTGMKTEIGAIAQGMHDKSRKLKAPKRREDGTVAWLSWPIAFGLSIGDMVGRFLGVNVGTPLQRKLSQLAILLFCVAIVFAVIVEAANEFDNTKEVVVYAVGTGISMIPASLIVVLTITMSIGTKRMVKRNVIVRNLDSLEALGGVTDVCSDKTGTLTQGKMIVKKAWIPSVGTLTVGPSDNPIDPTRGSVQLSREEPSNETEKSTPDDSSSSSTKENATKTPFAEGLEDFLNIATLCNLATIKQIEGSYKATGDPTEIAIQVLAHRFDWSRSKWTTGHEPAWSEVAEFPFDSDVKRMSVIYRNNVTGEHMVFAKGAVERILEKCHTVRVEDGQRSFDESFKAKTLKNMEALADQGLRVLALAQKSYMESNTTDDFENLDRDVVEQELCFVGLVGLYDPPRTESAAAVKECQRAGINVHMLTGDHPGTAAAIAKTVGILPSNMSTLAKDLADCMVMTGSGFDKLSETEIDNLPILPLVIARCAPQTKVRMIEALHRRGKFCAMTGDGVNDSPSLKRADIGIAMGQNGSDVAKEASDIVLSDDNFASILNAIEEGRRIFDNIKKFILHLLSGNIGQALCLLVGLVFFDETDRSVFPLSPVEILWIIMITSSFPAMGLGMERASLDIMDREPHNTKQGVFSWEIILDMFVYGVSVGALSIVSFVTVVYGYFDGDLGLDCNARYGPRCTAVYRGRSVVFVVMTWSLLILAFEMIDMRQSLFNLRPRNGRSALTAACTDLYENKFLFWSSVLGGVSVVPTLYIPVINDRLFFHTGIGWEWGLCFGFSLLFIAWVEAWKYCKRRYYRLYETNTSGNDPESMGEKHFERYLSMARSDVSRRSTK